MRKLPFAAYLDPRCARTALLAILTGAALLLGVGQASAQLKAPGEVRWFVDATTNVIVNSTSFASVPIPTGHTAVLKSVVDAACSCASRMRGLWDGTTYTLPASLKPPTTDAARLKAAARVLHQRLTVLAEGLDRVSTFWPAADVALGHNMIAYAHRGVRGVVLSGAWTVGGKLVFMTQTGAGPLDVASPGEFFERIEEEAGFADPALRADPRVLWVNPDTGIRVNLDQWVDEAVDYNDEGNTTTVRSRMAAETDDLTDYIGGAWINSI